MHVSLDSALGRQRRLNQVGETISSIAAPTAAYSLRSLTGGDPKVVRVRRESDNDEQDFTASEVASGAMLSYVNTQAIKPLDIRELTSGGSDNGRNGDFILAKAAYSLRSLGTRQATITSSGDTAGDTSGKYVVQVRRNVNGDQKSFTADEVADGTLLSFVNESFTSSLPLDVQGSATVAYSLRNLSSSYSGNVVEVRRSSDDDVQTFTANEVTDGTLLSFVNNDLNIRQTIISNSNSYDSTSGTGTLTSSSSISFTASGASSLVVSKSGFPEDFDVLAGKIKVTYNASGLSGGARILPRNTAGSSSGDAITVSNGTGNTGTTTLTGETNLFIFDGISGSDVSLEITSLEILGDGFVKTWYDQSGNTQNAVQTAPAQQPKIVDAGVLVERSGSPAIKSTSDASNQNALNVTFSSLSADGKQSVFSVLENDVTSNSSGHYGGAIDVRSTTSAASGANRRPWWFIHPTDGALYFSVDSLSGYNNTDRDKRLYSHIMNGSSGTNNGTSTVHQDGTQVDTRSITLDANSTFSSTQIGRVNANSAGALYISEIIYYPSDQVEKRRALEESIAGHHGITLGSFNRDGFVRTWYDQSVTGQDATTGTPNGNHATQATAASQPKIVNAGSLLADGLTFDGSDDSMTTTSAISSTNIAIACVSKSANNATAGLFSMIDDYNDGQELLYLANTIRYSLEDSDLGVSTTTTNKNLYFANYDGSTQGLSINGTNSTQSVSKTVDTITSVSRIGARHPTTAANFLNGSIEELIVYTDDQSANRTAIEANIGSVYSIDLPSGVDPGFDQVDGFVETWYDQSGNANNATQPTASKQPKIVNAGTMLNELEFDGSNHQLDFTALNESDISIFSVPNFDDAAGQDRILSSVSGGGDNSGFGKDTATAGFFRASSGSANKPALNATISADQDIVYSFIRASNTGTFFTNGTASSTFSNSTNFTPASIGGHGSKIDGSLKELIIYDSDQTAKRAALETNIAAEYGVTLS